MIDPSPAINPPPRPKVVEIFTPRSADVNDLMYIRRPTVESELKRSVEGSLHTVLCGESGSGKSWLYRYVVQKEGWALAYANAGNAARFDSLAIAIARSATADHDESPSDACINLANVSEGSDSSPQNSLLTPDLLKLAFASLRKRHPSQTIVLAIDNLEAIFSKNRLMEELGNIILLLDDPDYAKFRIKLLLVGVPTDIIEYFQSTENLETVANRLKELPALYSLTKPQLLEFAKRGFTEQLRIAIGPTDLPPLVDHIESVTLGIPQRLHEYCVELGHRIEDGGWRYDPKYIHNADNLYLHSALRKAYSVIDGCMNERKTKAGRRNQVLFALGKITAVNFDAKDIEAVVREHFPESTQDTALGVSQTLSDLSKGKFLLLRRNAKGNSYRFADPRYLMCLRVMLVKSETGERVSKRTFRR